MNGTGSTPPPGPGTVAPGQTAFYDSAVPPLPAGDYQLIIQQTVQVTPKRARAALQLQATPAGRRAAPSAVAG